MGEKSIIIGARSSQLARLQVDEALAHIEHLWDTTPTWQKVYYQTPGDRNQQISLTDPKVTDDFFTRDLDQLLLNHEADITVHSAKDLPEPLHEELEIAALLPARDIRDALVIRPGQEPIIFGTSSPRREGIVRQFFPNAILKPIRGTIQDRLAQLDAGTFDAVIIAACALQRLGLEACISEYLPADPTPQQGRLALVTRKTDNALNGLLAKVDVRRNAGLVALVGCPADPAMISKRAQDYIEQADIIFHDRLVPSDLLQPHKQKCISVGKAGGQKLTVQPDIHRQLLHEAEKGKLVVRLHGGDPCIYGHLAEELDFLHGWDLRTDIVSAPTAAQVASAHAYAPLTFRGEGGHVTFIPGHLAKSTQPVALPGPQAGQLAVYMGVRTLPQIVEQLTEAGWPADTPIVVGEQLGFKHEAIHNVRLKEAPALTLQTPAIVLIGARRFPGQDWTLFVGTDPTHFLKYGPLLHWPLIQLTSSPIDQRCAILERTLPHVDGILFPSRHAVHAFMEALLQEKDARALHDKIILAVGPATEKELASYGLRADGAATSLHGVRALADKITPAFHGKFLYPCSDASPIEDRIRTLADKGIELCPEIFYQNQQTKLSSYPRLPVARVLFTSSTTVRAYFEAYPSEINKQRTWLSVGPSTSEALEKIGVTPTELRSA